MLNPPWLPTKTCLDHPILRFFPSLGFAQQRQTIMRLSLKPKKRTREIGPADDERKLDGCQFLGHSRALALLTKESGEHPE